MFSPPPRKSVTGGRCCGTRRDQAAAAADVEHERHAGVLERAHTGRSRGGSATCRSGRRVGRCSTAPQPDGDRLVDRRHGRARGRPAARSRRRSGGGRPRRSRPCPGCGPGRRRRAVEVVADELGRARTWLNTSWLSKPSRSRARLRSAGSKAPSAVPALGRHERRLERRRPPRRRPGGPRPARRPRRPASPAPPRYSGRSRSRIVGVGVGLQPARQLHDVAVGVVGRAPAPA